MKPSNRQLLTLWRNDPAWTPNFRQICSALGIRKAQQRQVSAALSQFVDQGVLHRRGQRYALQDPSALVQPKATGRSRPPVAKEKPSRAGRKSTPSPLRQSQGDSLIGVFSAHPNGYGFVELTGERDALFIPPKAIAGAMDGDRVRAERNPGRGRDRTSGRIIEIIERHRSEVRGHVRKEYDRTWVAPFNEKLPLVFIPDDDADATVASVGDHAVVSAAITHFPEHHDEAPEGRILRVFDEDADTPEQVVLHILADLTLSSDFSAGTEAEMLALDPEPPAASGHREDLRELPFITIDGEDARDFDDAICLKSLRGGRTRLWVAIADVAAYVHPDTAVDADAWKKGTSVYFPNQVFPMLPERLSNDLCSLRPNEPKLTLTCEMELDAEGKRLRYRIFESLIESHARLTYSQVQRFFEGGNDDALPLELQGMLTAMRALAATLRARRQTRGALDFSFPEYKFELDRKGLPRRVREVYPTEATRLIEQFMLEANETVAEHCAEHELAMLYRVHDPPPPDQVRNLAVTLLNFGVEIREGELRRPNALQSLLKQVENHPQREQIEVAILRTLSQAVYRDSNDGHFALAAQHYTHFTSPIRRYPDLLLHRALKASFGRKRRPFVPPTDAGLHLSVCERTAGEAENRVVKLYKVLYMEPHLGERFPAVVAGVSERGLWLRLRDEPIDGLLPLDTLPQEARYDRDRNRLVTRGRGPNVGLGDRLRAKLIRADRLTQQLEFALDSWGWEDAPQRVETKPVHARKASAPSRTKDKVGTKSKRRNKSATSSNDRNSPKSKAKAKPKTKAGTRSPARSSAARTAGKGARQAVSKRKGKGGSPAKGRR